MSPIDEAWEGDPSESKLGQLEPMPKLKPLDPGMLVGQVAIVSGGGWNIGRAIAMRFARSGARVIITSRNRANLEETVADATREDLYMRHVVADLIQPTQVADMVEDVLCTEKDIDILACMAGGFGASQSLEETDPDEWLDVVMRNLYSTYLCCRSVLPRFLAKERGSILTCAGGGAFFPIVGVNSTAYATAKAGICRFTDQLYAELMDKTGIRINCLEPGMTWSPKDLERIEASEKVTGRRHPLRERNHTPEDGAELALFLLSPGAKALNGRLLSVDEDWWRNPKQVKKVADSDLYRLRRTFLD